LDNAAAIRPSSDTVFSGGLAVRDSVRNSLVGLFVLGGLVVLGALVVLFGRDPALTSSRDAYTLSLRFDSAYGIRSGTMAVIGGIPVGRVISVDFVDRERFEQGVEVRVGFDPGIRLRRGTQAQTTEPGLGMGRPPIILVPGPPTEPELASGAVIDGRITRMMDSLIPPNIVATFDTTAAQINAAAKALTPVLEDLHILLQQRAPELVDAEGGPGGNLSTAMTRLDQALRHINVVLGDPRTQSHLRTSIENLNTITEDGKSLAADLKIAAADARAATAEAKTLIAKFQTTVDRTDEEIQRVSRSLTNNLDLAADFLTQLNDITRRAGKGEGTIGLLLTDDRLYESMTLTFRRLAEAVDEFKALIKDWQQGKIKVAL